MRMIKSCFGLRFSHARFSHARRGTRDSIRFDSIPSIDSIDSFDRSIDRSTSTRLDGTSMDSIRFGVDASSRSIDGFGVDARPRPVVSRRGRAIPFETVGGRVACVARRSVDASRSRARHRFVRTVRVVRARRRARARHDARARARRRRTRPRCVVGDVGGVGGDEER